MPKQRASSKNKRIFAYVGCFTTAARHGKGRGILVFRISPTTGTWRSVQHVGGLVNPSWLLANRDGTVFAYRVIAMKPEVQDLATEILDQGLVRDDGPGVALGVGTAKPPKRKRQRSTKSKG